METIFTLEYAYFGDWQLERLKFWMDIKLVELLTFAAVLEHI